MAHLMRKRLLAAAVVTGLLSVALAAPAVAADPGWILPGYASGNTYYNPNESVINGGSITKLTKKWAAKLATTEEEPCTHPSEPLVAGGRVFVTDEVGVGAYQVATGAKLWHFDWELPSLEHTPALAVAGGRLVMANTECDSVSDPDGGIVALDVATGQVKWSTRVGPISSLVVDKSVVAVSGWSMSSDPAVHAFRLGDGQPQWTLDGYKSAGVSAGGRPLVHSDDGIAALSITTGQKLWTTPLLLSGLAANPAGDRFYLADGDGGLQCVKAADGTPVWHVNGTGGAIAADGKRVYRGVSTSVEALDAKTGRRLWTTRFGATAFQPVRAGGLLYTTVDGQGLKILTAATGRTAAAWKFGPADEGRNVVVAGGRLFQIKGQTLQVYAPR